MVNMEWESGQWNENVINGMVNGMGMLSTLRRGMEWAYEHVKGNQHWDWNGDIYICCQH